VQKVVERTKALAVGSALVAASLMVTACSGSSGSASSNNGDGDYPPIPEGPIKLGASLPLSGPGAEAGLVVKKGLNGLVEYFNKTYPDGIDGHPIEIDFFDDAGDPTKAVNAAKQMVANQDAAAIFLSFNPEASPLQAAVLMKAKLPVVTANAGIRQFTDVQRSPYYFNVLPSNQQYADASAAWLAKHPEIKRVAYLTDGQVLANDFKDSLTSALSSKAPGVSIVKEVTVNPGSVDLSAPIAQLKAENPDLVLVNLSYGYGAVWQAMRSANLSPKILMAPAAFYDGFDAMGNLASDAFVFFSMCAKDAEHTYPAQMVEIMESSYANSGPSWKNYPVGAAGSVGPLLVLKAAIEKIHSVDPDGLKQAIDSLGNLSYFDGEVQFNFGPTRHFGSEGPTAAQVCRAAPLGGGKWNVPIIAP